MIINPEYQIVKREDYYEITYKDSTWKNYSLSNSEYNLWVIFQKFASRFKEEEIKELEAAIDSFGYQKWEEGQDDSRFNE